MSEEKASCQQIVITHKCGGTFTIYPESFLANFDKDSADPRHTPICLNCFEPIAKITINQLGAFCQEYRRTIKNLSRNEFEIALIQSDDSKTEEEKKNFKTRIRVK